MKQRLRSGGLAAWSINHPIGVVMLSLTVVVLGFFSLDRLGVDLLPHIIYPEVRVRVLDPGVPAKIMEDQVTRQLEEQLSITEGAISVQSTSSEGASSIDISFPYGTNIDIALRDASIRLDRARRFLPDSIDPPIIYKWDPSQIPVLELAISSTTLDPVKLREWVDYEFSRWFINLPGVAAAEVGGGNAREIQIIIDQERLASFGLSFEELKNKIQQENLEISGGRLTTRNRELSTRTLGRFKNLEDIKNLPLRRTTDVVNIIRLKDVAQVLDTHEDERLRVRLNQKNAIKLSIQKQPLANTVAVIDAINKQLAWLHKQKLVPQDITIATISDQSIFIRYALRNASIAAISGAILAMLVVYLFLGNLKRTLIIGSAIPLAILFTFIIMSLSGLTLNIMTLGALALGVGLLIDSTIIMLENITRHQRLGEQTHQAAVHAAQEINSAIVAATSTNLAAILPFLFIGGLVGLLFSELIYVLTAAILASLVVAITLVPSLGSRVTDNAQPERSFGHKLQTHVDNIVQILNRYLGNLLPTILKKPCKPFYIIVPLLLLAGFFFTQSKQSFLPSIDEGQIRIYITSDTGTQFKDFDKMIIRLENIYRQQPEVESVFTTSGGFIFGRTEHKSGNSGSIYVQLKPGNPSEKWINKIRKLTAQQQMAGIRVRMHARGIRGIRISRGDDDLSLRVQGPDLSTLANIGADIVDRLRGLEGVRNISQTYEEAREQITIQVNRQRAADLGINVKAIGDATRIALEGTIVSEYLSGDRRFNIRMRLPKGEISSPDKLNTIIVGYTNHKPVRLGEVASIKLLQSPSQIKRDKQRRIVEISGSLKSNANLKKIKQEIEQRLDDLQLPEGYSLYDGGSTQTLKEGQQTGIILILLAIFLVFVVMSVQYESLVNPVIILLSMPFALIGVAFGLWLTNIFASMPVTMPVWLGLVMLIGIVVNNAIVLVEQIEIERERGLEIDNAIIRAVQLRLRPIMMTTLTTVVGMLPLAIGIGSGSEMLQPLAIVIVWGLLFSSLISLLIVPALYKLLHRGYLQNI